MPFEIGILQAEEIEAAAELWRICELVRPWNDAHDDAVRALEGSQSTILAGRVEGVLVATAMVGQDGHRGWVYYLAVHPEHRKRGYARRMMRESEKWVADRGIAKMNIMVRNDNAPVAGFYAAIGYEPSEVAVVARWLKEPRA